MVVTVVLYWRQRPLCKVGLPTPRKRMYRRGNAAHRHEFLACKFKASSPAKLRKMKLVIVVPEPHTARSTNPTCYRPNISVDAMD